MIIDYIGALILFLKDSDPRTTAEVPPRVNALRPYEETFLLDLYWH
jgi:hypothetical protein